MKFSVPEHIVSVMELMHNANFTPYLVGGCVRDYIMGITPHDYDITVNANPDELTELFAANGYKAELKGQTFGTVAVLCGGEFIEITPHRTESDYKDSRHPDRVEFVKDIKSDLVRRDFTVNAIAMDKDGNILDVFGGCTDISGKIIKCIGNPEVRFSEDALRILRAVRFASRLGFTIDRNTRKAMTDKKSGLANISAERIVSEFRGTFIYPHSYATLKDCTDIICEIIPGFEACDFLLSDKGDFASRLFSCIYKCSEKEIYCLCDKLHLTKAESDKIKAMYKLYHSVLTHSGNKVIFDITAKRALCDFDTDYVVSAFEFSGSDCSELRYFVENGVYTAKKLALNGGDIATSGMFPKNETAKILKKVLYEVSSGKITNNKDSIFEYLSTLKNQSE